MKWISIKEPPTDNNNNGDAYDCVLLFNSYNKSIAFGQYLEGEWVLLSDGVYSDVGTIGTDLENITHWMPLPQYPRRGS